MTHELTHEDPWFVFLMCLRQCLTHVRDNGFVSREILLLRKDKKTKNAKRFLQPSNKTRQKNLKQ